jgi:ADP-ribosyl-[dinitrogen reductase] hydrolase
MHIQNINIICSPLIFVAIFCNRISQAMIPSQPMIESRIRGALWGLFSGDALASPTHWYYGGFPQIQRDYGRDGITGYTKPTMNLSGSILNKSDPNGGGRLKFSSRENNLSIIGDVINHGKLKYWDPKLSIHYHATLEAGENTLEAQLVRVLMKSIVDNNGCFDADHFRRAYIDFMTREGSHNDTYASTCHRMFFANMIFNKLDPHECP